MRALEKMTFCPELRYASEVAILIDAFSYADRCLSYCATSYFSLLKCCQVGWGERHNGPRSVNCTHLYGLVVDERIDCDRRSFVVRAVCLSSEAGSVKPMSLDLHKIRTITDLQDVVRTVNQVYAAMVTRVIAAKSHPNL